MKKTASILLCVGLMAQGCILRSTDDYRTDTRALIETKSGDITGCYDAALANGDSVAGKVVVNFKVAKKTGQVHDVNVLPESTAPEALQGCVASALEGLALDPGDMAPGDATFTWSFSAS